MSIYYRRAGSIAELKGCSSTFSGLPPVGGSVVSLVPGITLSQGVPHESQTTNPNQQLTISRGKEDDFCLIFKWICLDSRSKNCKLCPTNFTKPKILSSFFLDAFCKQQIELTNGASDSRKSNLMMDDFGQTHDLLFLLSILKTGQTQLN